jgi:hypothetical protein
MEFVTFEIAKKLKEKGFREKCLYRYKYYSKTLHPNRVEPKIVRDINYSEFFKCYNSFVYSDIDAPTISQVLKWFRKEHHLHFEVVGAAYGYNLIISDTPDKGGTDRYYSHANDDGPNYAGAWDDHDDCVLYGIEYVLDNLI